MLIALTVRSLRDPVQRHINVGEQAASVICHGHPLPVNLADERIVGMTGDHQIHRIVEPDGDVCNRAGESRSAIVLPSVGEPALGKKHDDGFDALFLQLGHQGIDCFHLIFEGQARHPATGDNAWGLFQGQPDECHLHALVIPDGIGREDGFASGVIDDVGGEELEVGARKGIAVEVAVNRVRPAMLHPQQLRYPLIEFMVAHAVDIQAHEIHGFNGGFVVEERRDQWRRSDEVPGRHEHGVLRSVGDGCEVGCQEVRSPNPAEGTGRSRDVAVEIIDRQDLELHLSGLVARLVAGLRSRGNEAGNRYFPGYFHLSRNLNLNHNLPDTLDFPRYRHLSRHFNLNLRRQWWTGATDDDQRSEDANDCDQRSQFPVLPRPAK